MIFESLTILFQVYKVLFSRISAANRILLLRLLYIVVFCWDGSKSILKKNIYLGGEKCAPEKYHSSWTQFLNLPLQPGIFHHWTNLKPLPSYHELSLFQKEPEYCWKYLCMLPDGLESMRRSFLQLYFPVFLLYFNLLKW